LPLGFFLAYLTFTVVLFAYGPWPWPVRDGTKLYGFLTLAHLALFLGYTSAAGQRPSPFSAERKVGRLVLLSLLVNLALLVPTSLVRTGRIIPDYAGALANPGLAYASARLLREGGGNPVEYARIVLGPLLYLLFPLTVFYWQRLRWRLRIPALLSLFGFLSLYVATGTNKALADFVIVTPWLVLASYLARRLRLSRRMKLMAVGALAAALALFLLFFSTAIRSRVGSAEGVSYFNFLGIWADQDNALLRPLPDEARPGAIALAAYLNNGYYGLYLALNEPYVPTFGVGNSFFLANNAARLTGAREIEELSYPMRLQRAGKWNAAGLWSSVYPWIASDVSFPGTLVVVFLVGRLFALAWLDTLRGQNPFAVAAFAQLVAMLFYFPANNQALQSGEPAASFLGLLAVWLFTRGAHRPARDTAVPA
jgi:hypothetical protein